MSRGSYKNFLRLFEKWPIDNLKGDRDLGQHLRNLVAASFKQGSATSVNEEECNHIYESLKRIEDDKYKKLYKRKRDSTASGISVEELRAINSDEYIVFPDKEDK